MRPEETQRPNPSTPFPKKEGGEESPDPLGGGVGEGLPGVREARLLTDSPWVRSLGRLELSISTEGWKFPSPPLEYASPSRLPTDAARWPA